METKIQIKSIFGEVKFEYECENNSIKKTVEHAVKKRINLSYSNLSDSNLSYSNLSGSNLRGSNLSDSNLRGSNLSYSRNTESAYLPIFCKWSNSIIGNKIQIGCKTKTIEEWEEFFNSDEEFETKRGTDDFKQIQAVFESYKAYINFLNQ